MICDICGKDTALVKQVTRSFSKKKDTLIIENIPVVSCPACGESYMTAETLYEIERIKIYRHSFAVKRPVEVAAFASTDRGITVAERFEGYTSIHQPS